MDFHKCNEEELGGGGCFRVSWSEIVSTFSRQYLFRFQNTQRVIIDEDYSKIFKTSPLVCRSFLEK